MIILLDSAIFISDPECRGVAWRALAHAAPAWDIRILTTDVVFAESVAGFERNILGWQRELGKLSRALGSFGLKQLLAGPLEAIGESSKSYSERFAKMLAECGVEVYRVPEIPHMDIVRRSISRRKPCDGNGNGYRDTLNWLTFLRIVADNPDEQLVWVTSDTDFLSTDNSGLHPDLIEDLEGIAASDRVSWSRDLKEFVLKVARERSIKAGDDLRAVADQLRDESVIDYLTKNVLSAALESPLDGYACGLPLDAPAARLLRINNSRNLNLQITGSIPDDQVLGEFELEADVTIELVSLSASAEDDASPESPSDQDPPGHISKPLIFRGIITLSVYGKPQTAELSAIEALADDPGRRRWDEARAVAEQLHSSARAFQGLTLPPGYIQGFRLPPEYFKLSQALQGFRLPPEYFKLSQALQGFRLPPGYFQAVRALQGFKLPPEYFKGMHTTSGPASVPVEEDEEPDGVDEGTGDDEPDE